MFPKPSLFQQISGLSKNKTSIGNYSFINQYLYFSPLQDVLAEVPHQVSEYMTRKGLKPGVPDVSTVLKVESMSIRH